VLDSKVLAAVILPVGLTERINAYQPSEIEVVIDPTQEQFARIITGLMKDVVSPVVIQGEISYAIRTLLSEYPSYQQAGVETRQAYEAQNVAVQMAQVMKMRAQPWVSVEAKTQTGEDMVKIPTNMFVLMVPSFTVMFAFFVVGDISKELLKEKREGSMRRFMAAPIHPWMIILAKMLAYITLVLIQVVVIFGVASLAFDMPLGNSLPGLALVSMAMALAATISKTEKQADTTGLLMGFALAALGGCFVFGTPVPLYKGGGIMEVVSNFTPQAHALMGYDILLNEGGGLVQALPQALILLGFAALGFAVASARFKFE
jgi:ABC-2 type transport system permease protein